MQLTFAKLGKKLNLDNYINTQFPDVFLRSAIREI